MSEHPRISEQDAQAQFRDALSAAGVDVSRVGMPVLDGKRHYVPLVGQRGKEKSAAYRGYYDGARPAGAIWNHKTGEVHRWRADGETASLSPEERAKVARDQAAAAEQRDRDRVVREVAAAQVAQWLLDGTRPASPDHPYLKVKGVQPHGARENLRGELVVPLRDADGALWNVQTIAADGTKRYLTGARKNGMHHTLGDVRPDAPRVFAEGFATAAAFREDTGAAVVMALDTSNLPHVARAYRDREPGRPFLIAADNDAHLPLRPVEPGRLPKDNAGLAAAEKTAREVGATILAPPEVAARTAADKGTDWQDYRKALGPGSVAARARPALDDLTRKGRDMSDAADPFDRAVAFVRAENRVSTKALQNGLGLSFDEATAAMSRMEREGVISRADGINPVRVLPAEVRSPAAEGRIPAPLAADDPRHQSMDFAGQKIEADYRLAHTLGVVERVERLAAEGLTARQTVERLGPALDRVHELARLNGEPHFADKNKDDLVRAVRNKLDIPALDDRAEFAAWLASRGPGGDRAPLPSPGESRAEAATAAPERGDIPPVNGPDEGRAVARILQEAKQPDADPERIRATLAPFDDVARGRITDRATWALDRRAEVTGDRASSEVLALALAAPEPTAPPKLDPASVPVPPAPGAGNGRPPPGDTPLSADAQTIYQAVSKLLETHHIVAAEDLKPRVSAMLAAREAEGDRIVLTPDIRLAAGKPPVHTLDEMRDMFAAVRERAAAPSDRMTPETAAEVREGLQAQFKGARSMVDLMKLYAGGDVQRAIKSLDAHPEQRAALAATTEAVGKRLLAEDRVKLGLDEPAERRRSRSVQDAPGDVSGSAPDAPGITITRRGDNGVPPAPKRAVDPLAQAYDIREKGDERHYVRRDDGKLAMRATETHIHGVQRDAATIGAMLDLAVSRGWNDVQIKGDRDVARVAWIEASARGLKAEGYVPTRDDRHAAEQRRVERREQGLNAPAAPERAAVPERPRTAEAPERTSGRAGREDRASWVKGTGGYDALGPAQREHAERAHTNWRAANPDRAELQDIRDYVGFVQGKEAERRHAREDRRHGRDERDDERHPPPPKVELPRRSLGL